MLKYRNHIQNEEKTMSNRKRRRKSLRRMLSLACSKRTRLPSTYFHINAVEYSNALWYSANDGCYLGHLDSSMMCLVMQGIELFISFWLDANEKRALTMRLIRTESDSEVNKAKQALAFQIGWNILNGERFHLMIFFCSFRFLSI